jgi:hypothetical protein
MTGEGPRDTALIQLCYCSRPSFKRKASGTSYTEVTHQLRVGTELKSCPCRSVESKTVLMQPCRHLRCMLKEDRQDPRHQQAFEGAGCGQVHRPGPRKAGKHSQLRNTSKVLCTGRTLASEYWDTSSQLAPMLPPLAPLLPPRHAVSNISAVGTCSAQTCKHGLNECLPRGGHADSRAQPLVPAQPEAQDTPANGARVRALAGCPSDSEGCLMQPCFPHCQCLLFHVKRTGVLSLVPPSCLQLANHWRFASIKMLHLMCCMSALW